MKKIFITILCLLGANAFANWDDAANAYTQEQNQSRMLENQERMLKQQQIQMEMEQSNELMREQENARYERSRGAGNSHYDSNSNFRGGYLD